MPSELLYRKDLRLFLDVDVMTSRSKFGEVMWPSSHFRARSVICRPAFQKLLKSFLWDCWGFILKCSGLIVKSFLLFDLPRVKIVFVNLPWVYNLQINGIVLFLVSCPLIHICWKIHCHISCGSQKFRGSIVILEMLLSCQEKQMLSDIFKKSE